MATRSAKDKTTGKAGAAKAKTAARKQAEGGAQGEGCTQGEGDSEDEDRGRVGRRPHQGRAQGRRLGACATRPPGGEGSALQAVHRGHRGDARQHPQTPPRDARGARGGGQGAAPDGAPRGAGRVRAGGRPRDPVAILERQEKDRLQFLLPVRHARMLQNAFGFYRGAPAVMAADLGAGLRTDLEVQLCGDAHLLNFGMYGSPERSLVFDINDFDETLPGPFEWDVKRLIASLVVAARQNGIGGKKARGHRARRRALLPHVHAPVRRAGHADDLVHAARRGQDPGRHPRPRAAGRRGQDRRQGDQPRQRPGGRQADAPWWTGRARSPARRRSSSRSATCRSGCCPATSSAATKMNYDTYRQLAAPATSSCSSTGTASTTSRSRSSASAPSARAASSACSPATTRTTCCSCRSRRRCARCSSRTCRSSRYKHQGERVVTGQRLTQSASDIFLGWSHGPAGGDFYWRQLRDWKGSVDADDDGRQATCWPTASCAPGRWPRATRARATRSAISSYLGKKDRFDVAMADFAEKYAAPERGRLRGAAAGGRGRPHRGRRGLLGPGARIRGAAGDAGPGQLGGVVPVAATTPASRAPSGRRGRRGSPPPRAPRRGAAAPCARPARGRRPAP